MQDCSKMALFDRKKSTQGSNRGGKLLPTASYAYENTSMWLIISNMMLFIVTKNKVWFTTCCVQVAAS